MGCVDGGWFVVGVTKRKRGKIGMNSLYQIG